MTASNLQAFFGNEADLGLGGLRPEVNFQLQRSASRVSSRSDALAALRKAWQLAPNQLSVLVASYTFHFCQGDFEAAEDWVFQTLIKASQQGGFDHDWRRLSADSADWSDPRGPARLFITGLKTLAFIRLRQQDPQGARSILQALERIDPNDQVGADVVRDLLAALSEEGGDDV